MTGGVFVTGTDTACGKTYVSVAVIRALRARGLRVAGFKPVAAGADWHDGALRNDDALALAAASGLDIPYGALNPYCFEPPVAPHLAAAEAGTAIDFGRVTAAYAEVAAAADFTVVEGAGGWLVPLGRGRCMRDLAVALRLPVVLVVGLRLGCLNHALLSEQAIRSAGVPALGWIGSVVDPAMARLAHNVDALQEFLSMPCLGFMPHRQDLDGDGPDHGLVLDSLVEPAR